MKYETKYGIVELKALDDGFEVVSTVPFKKCAEKFSGNEYNKAVKEFKAVKAEVEKVIKEMETVRKSVVSSKSAIHKQLNNILKKEFKRVLLYGPTGTGKTYTIIEMLKEWKEQKKLDDYLVVTFSSGMEDIDILGKFLPDAGKVVRFQPSELYEFMKSNKDKKVAVVFDEFNRANSRTLNILIPMLDGRNGEVVINNFIKGETVAIPEENVTFLFTANFGASYSGTFSLDEAILNRIDLCVFCDYQKEVEEAIMDELPEDKKKLLEEIRDFFRDAFKQGMIHPFTTRDLKNSVVLMQSVSMDANSVFEGLKPVLDKLVKVDPQGYPDEEFCNEFKQFLQKKIENSS